MFTLTHVYILCGIYLIIFALLSFRDKKNKHRLGTGFFWLFCGITFFAGDWLSNEVAGGMILCMALIVLSRQMGRGEYDEASTEKRQSYASRLGNRVFLPVLCVGIITFLLAALSSLRALVSFALASVLALLVALLLTRESPTQTFQEGRRLLDAIGWAAILSQLLAALGALFDKAGVGTIVSQCVASIIPTDNALAVTVAYCLGMALFTMIMGNAFAAFAVITSGIGIPLVIAGHGANPLIAGPIAMLSGYCGTLLTPMAANFNIVPAALLEMKDRHGVIRAQAPLALLLLIANICLLYGLGFGS